MSHFKLGKDYPLSYRQHMNQRIRSLQPSLSIEQADQKFNLLPRLPRHDDYSLMSYTDMGGYPLFYLTQHNACLCPTCARKQEEEYTAEEDRAILENEDPVYPYADDPITACDINYEDPDLYCDGCNERIESAYAEEDPPPLDEIEFTYTDDEIARIKESLRWIRFCGGNQG